MQKKLASICLSLTLLSGMLAGPGAAFAATTPNDPYYPYQWYLERIGASRAWDTTTGAADVVVAVLDSGVDIHHEDLADNIWNNPLDIYGDGIDNDNDGYIDDTYGYDFVGNQGLPMPVAGVSVIDPASILHGTLVSGIIGAIGNNGLGVAGITWHTKIMPVRVLNANGNGASSTILSGIHYAVDHGANIINLSFSGSVNDDRITEALNYAYEHNVVVVAAAGNDGKDINAEPTYPSCSVGADGQDIVIGVGASNLADERATFSNFGSNCVDITAPGTDFVGLQYFDLTTGYDKKYTSGWNGTSLAAPVVSGTLALVLAKYPGFTPDQLKMILQMSADPITGVDKANMGAGRVNIEKALAVAADLWAQAAVEPAKLDFVRTADSPGVYLVKADGTRAVVLDTKTFFTYAADFSGVRTISTEEMANYKFKGIVLPQAGRVLVKIQSDPKVYWLAKNPQNAFAPILRSIPNEATAIKLFGADWASYVIDIEPTMFKNFGHGTDLSATEKISADTLIKRVDLGK